MKVVLQGDWQKFEERLERLGRVNFTAMHKNVGEEVLSQIAERFRTTTDPKGNKWLRSIRAKEKAGQTLSESGRLKRSYTYRASADQVQIGTNDKRALIHQNGGIIRPKKAKFLLFKLPSGQWVQTKKVKMPRRAMLGFSWRNEYDIMQVVNDFLKEAADQ